MEKTLDNLLTNSWSLNKLMSIELVMPSNHLISVIPFSSCLQSFPASGSFPMSQFFTSSGQTIGVSPLKCHLSQEVSSSTHLRKDPFHRLSISVFLIALVNTGLSQLWTIHQNVKGRKTGPVFWSWQLPQNNAWGQGGAQEKLACK